MGEYRDEIEDRFRAQRAPYCKLITRKWRFGVTHAIILRLNNLFKQLSDMFPRIGVLLRNGACWMR